MIGLTRVTEAVRWRAEYFRLWFALCPVTAESRWRLKRAEAHPIKCACGHAVSNCWAPRCPWGGCLERKRFPDGSLGYGST